LKTPLTAANLLSDQLTTELCQQALQNVLPMLHSCTSMHEPHRVGMYFKCITFLKTETKPWGVIDIIHEYHLHVGAKCSQLGLDSNIKRKIRQALRTKMDGASLYDEPGHYEPGDFPYDGLVICGNFMFVSSGRNHRMDNTMCTAWKNECIHLIEQKLKNDRPYTQDMEGDRGIVRTLF
jgi:hypothetical protein